MADKIVILGGTGAEAYLNAEEIIEIAKDEGCDAIHPGYGFLSENVTFAERCADEGLVFVGPLPEILSLFGNKAEARALARRCGVPLVPGTIGATTFEEAAAFFRELGHGAAVMIKAIGGGGGRGMRSVRDISQLEEAYTRCQSEARAVFGNSDVYVEQLIFRARHIEVQIVGDGAQVIHLGERDCTMQRRNQKLIEIAPCPTLSSELRRRLTDAALQMAREVQYKDLGTFEFLIGESLSDDEGYAFLEVNPRLQVEHTVTEEVTGVDLVKTQIAIASGKSLDDLGLAKGEFSPRGCALQLRINMETMNAEGSVTAETGVLSAYEVPGGKDIRVDGYGYGGYPINPSFDSLLAKLIVYSSSQRYEDVVRKAYRALAEFRIEGVATNIPFLQNLLSRPEVMRNDYYTRFIDEHVSELVSMSEDHRSYHFKETVIADAMTIPDNLKAIPPGTVPIRSVMQGQIVNIAVIKGDAVVEGQKLAVIEAMKMEHIIKSDHTGYIFEVCVSLGETVSRGTLLFLIEEAEVAESVRKAAEEKIDLDAIRPDLAEVIERHALTLDERRPEAVARRRKKNRRTARENIADLCDPDSFIEYGALTYAAQRMRRSVDDLIRNTPADGLITGIGTVNGSLFGDTRSRCMILAYDYTVLSGTQGQMGHKKLDRILRVADTWRLPTVLFAEGGGGRPGDTDTSIVAGLDIPSFSLFGGLSGKIPLVGIVEGPCFAGNACLLGCCDVIIATEHSNIGMGGPVMIEGGGLGVVKMEDIGPTDVQTRNGVVDVSVSDEKEAVAVAKKYLSYFQGVTVNWEVADQRHLRWLIPENRLRVYDVRRVIETLADTGSVLELRPQFGLGMITALIRIEGRPFGVIANDPAHMSGAIEPEGADKAVRFMQLCNAHGLPILSLCDTPGFMVGTEVESRAHVRHCCRMFIVGANLTVPFFFVVIRKGYGLGAQAMASGCFHNPFFTVSWPTGEFGGMGLEGAVRLALRKELAAIKDPKEREETFQLFVAGAYEMGKAMNTAAHLEIDAVIDPAETRRWIIRGLNSVADSPSRSGDRQFVDAW